MVNKHDCLLYTDNSTPCVIHKQHTPSVFGRPCHIGAKVQSPTHTPCLPPAPTPYCDVYVYVHVCGIRACGTSGTTKSNTQQLTLQTHDSRRCGQGAARCILPGKQIPTAHISLLMVPHPIFLAKIRCYWTTCFMSLLFSDGQCS